MSNISTLGFGTGLCVLLGFVTILFLMTQTPNSMGGLHTGYLLIARFDNIGDLKVGSPVSIAGVKIGAVTDIDFDLMTSKAVVSLRIDPKFNQIPKDSSANILSQSLLGGKFIMISPGGSSSDLQNGDEIVSTRSAVALEEFINRAFQTIRSQ